MCEQNQSRDASIFRPNRYSKESRKKLANVVHGAVQQVVPGTAECL
jgi:hypothetical protein